MAKYKAVEDSLASLQAVEWQALPPPAQRALFADLSQILLAMMKVDTKPPGKRRTSVDRARRTGDNENKVALMLAACDSLQFEAMDEILLRKVFDGLHVGVNVVGMLLQSRSSKSE